MTEEAQTTEQSQIVSGAALRAKARPHITNPETGNTYHVRRVAFSDLVLSGALPEEYIETGDRIDETKPADEITLRENLDRAKFAALEMRAIVTAALLAPRVVDEPESADECEYSDLPEGDRAFIYRWAKGIAEGSPVEFANGGCDNCRAVAELS